MNLERTHPYEIRESTRAKRVGLLVYPDGRVVVTKPVRAPEARVAAFVRDHAVWIESVQKKFARREEKAKASGPKIVFPRLRRGTHAYEATREKARALVTGRLQHYALRYGFTYGTISIRNQKTRWGSCSPSGNLSFSMKLAFLPPEHIDYIVVHELCHTREHNHSPRFWALVASIIPQYRTLRTDLRTRYML